MYTRSTPHYAFRTIFDQALELVNITIVSQRTTAVDLLLQDISNHEVEQDNSNEPDLYSLLNTILNVRFPGMRGVNLVDVVVCVG